MLEHLDLRQLGSLALFDVVSVVTLDHRNRGTSKDDRAVYGVLRRVGQHPGADVAQLTPRLWKQNFGKAPLRPDISRRAA